jgi:hypothetical protein
MVSGRRIVTPDDLYGHLVEVVIPLESKLDFPVEPATLSPLLALPDLPVFEKRSHYASRIHDIKRKHTNKEILKSPKGRVTDGWRCKSLMHMRFNICLV